MAKRTSKDVLSVKEVALMCDVSPETIRRWIKLHDLPAFNKTNRRAMKIRCADLDAFVKQGNTYINWAILGLKEPKT